MWFVVIQFNGYNNGKYSKNKQLQVEFLNDFCSSNEGIANYKQTGESFHKCEKIEAKEIVSNKLLQNKWRNYCSLRLFMEGCTFFRFNKKSNGSKSDILKLFRFRRNETGQFDTNRDALKNFQSTIKLLLKSEKNYVDEGFFMLWTGLLVCFFCCV